MKYVIVGTAGHIDHGKTALVKALTGIDCDRWEEEKRRGITIDIGFAGLDLNAETHVAFIDVPGHERFVKNMLAGAHGIDLLMLIVAADESIMPQTREHFEITKLLNIQSGLTVITKSDLVDSETLQVVMEEVRGFLKNSFLADKPILPVSARSGEGLDTLKSELKRLASGISQKSAQSYLRLPIDRAFSMKGFGAVITGTLISGHVSKDQEVEILPQRKRVRIRGLQVHNRSVETAIAGQRTAVNLQGIEVDEMARGMVLAQCDTFQPTTRLDVELTLIESAPAPLKKLDRVHFHHETSEMIATVHPLDRAQLKPGEKAFVQLALESPTVAQPGDRFVIRRLSPVITIGGGMILDPLPAKHDELSAPVRGFLEAALRHDLGAVLDYLIGASDTAGCHVDELVSRTGLSREILRAQLDVLLNRGRIQSLPTRLLSVESLQSLSAQMPVIVKEHHARNPLAVGISKQELKERLGARVSSETFEYVLGRLVEKKVLSLSKELVHTAGRSVALSAEEDTGKKIILEAFRIAGLAVPAVDEVLARVKIDRTRARQIVQLLVREGSLVRVTTDLMFHKDSIRELQQRLQKRKTASPRLSVGDFKEMTGISRKYAIPLLEFLDHERVTRREGDTRVIL